MHEITHDETQFGGHDSEINLHDVVAVLWTKGWFILLAAFVVAVAGGGAAFLVDKQYTAVVIVSPVSGSSTSGALSAVSSLAAQFGGLTALAGLSSSTDSKKSETIAVLQSEALTERYIRDNDLLPVLYEDKWDKEHKKWKVSDDKKVPTFWKANNLFKKRIRTVTTDVKTGLVTLNIKWKDPHLAAEWANGIVQLANNYMRDQAIRETERNIAYLNEQSSKTDIIGVRQAIYSLLQNEINKQMLARGNAEFAVKIIDPAFVPETPSSPTKVLWALVGAIGGMFVSITVVLFRNFRRPSIDAP